MAEFSNLLGYDVKDAKARNSIELLNNYVTPQMFGAVGDGVHDDTTAIQQAITNSNYIYFPSGEYKITNSITIPSDRTITGANTATIKQYTKNKVSFILHNVDNITVRDLTIINIEKSGVLGEREICFDIKHGTNITFERITAKKFVTVILTGYDTAVYNADITIKDCYFYNYDFAMLLAQFRDIVIDNVNGFDVERTVIEESGKLSPPHLLYVTDRTSALKPYNLTVVNCTETNNPYAESYKVRHCDNVIIANCKSYNCERGIEIASAKNVSVSNILIADMCEAIEGDTMQSVMHLYDVENVNVSDITANANYAIYGIRINTDKTEQNKNIKFSNCMITFNNSNGASKRLNGIENSVNVEFDNMTFHNLGVIHNDLFRVANSDVSVKAIKSTIGSEWSSYRYPLAYVTGESKFIIVIIPDLLPTCTTDNTIEEQYLVNNGGNGTCKRYFLTGV